MILFSHEYTLSRFCIFYVEMDHNLSLVPLMGGGMANQELWHQSVINFHSATIISVVTNEYVQL